MFDYLRSQKRPFTGNCSECGEPKKDRFNTCGERCSKRRWQRLNKPRRRSRQRQYRIRRGGRKGRKSEDQKERANLRARPYIYLLRCAKQRAKEKGFDYSLSIAWAEARWTGKCELTQILFVVGGNDGPLPFSPSLDRIDRTKGYIDGNSRFILHGLNSLKGRGTDEDMKMICRAVLKHEAE